MTVDKKISLLSTKYRKRITTIQKLVRELYPKHQPEGRVLVMELNEMWQMKRFQPWNVLFYCADHYEAYIGTFQERLALMQLKGIMDNRGISL